MTQPTVTTTEVAFRRSTLAREFGGDERLATSLGAAEILIVPHDRPQIGRTFPSHAREFYRRFQREWPEPARVEIAARDEDFQELVQHADLWVLPVLLLAEPTLGTAAINIVSNFIYDGLRRFRIPRRVEVESELMIERPEGTLSFKYRGPAEAYQRVMTDAVKPHLHLGSGDEK